MAACLAFSLSLWLSGFSCLQCPCFLHRKVIFPAKALISDLPESRHPAFTRAVLSQSFSELSLISSVLMMNLTALFCPLATPL